MKTNLLSALLIFSLPFALIAKTYHFDRSERSAGEVTIEKERGALSVSFSISSMDATPTARGSAAVAFNDLKFKSLKLSGELGAPALPYETIIVRGVPSQIKVTEDLGSEFVLDGVVPAPAQRTKMRCKDCEKKDFVVNWRAYQDDEKFYKVEYLGDFRGIPVSQVTLFPAVFSANDQGLRIYPKARFSVSSTASRGYFDAYKDPTTLISEASLNKDFLIIAPSAYVTTLKPFVDWKTSLGYKVSVFTLEEAGGSYTSVKTFIQNKYKLKAFTYAMLVGTESLFPTGYASTSGDPRTPSDLLYWTMGGSSDYIPDVLAGRFVVSSTTELTNQITKILEYEKGTFKDSKGLKKHIGIASNEGEAPSDVDYMQEMAKSIDAAFGLTSKFFFQANSDASSSNILKEISAGVHWLNYIGHGSGTSWPSIASGTFSGTTISGMSPDVVKPVVIDVACLNGNFNKGKFGERWMNSVNGSKPTGAVAYYGGSVSISWNPPAIMAIGINRIMSQKKLTHLGEVLFAGQMFMIANNSNQTENRDNLEWYHLFGDPSMKLRFDGQAPVVQPVSKNMNVEVGSYYVLVWNDDGDAIEGAKVTITKGYSKSVQYINADGWIYLPSWAKGTFKVSIEKTGYKSWSN